MDTAILISAAGASGPLRGLIDRLASIGVTITVVEELAAAVEQSAHSARPPAVLLDLRDVETSDDDEHASKVAETVRRALEALPHALPIVVTAGASVSLFATAIRAGAGDVLDVMMEGTAAARAIVQRICQRQASRQVELSVIEEQRAFIDEVLKDLIRTERRAIDAEDTLAARTRNSREIPLIDTQPPGVLLVENERRVADELAERIEAEGLAAFAYVSGEEAIRETALLAETSGLDLAVVAAHLPGMNGLDTIRALRDRTAGLPAFLLTSVGEEDLATPASDLGVIAMVQKPIASMEELVERITEVARESRHRTREALYLQRIKERHEHVLERYRTLPRAP